MKERAPKNRTIVLSDNDRKRLLKRLVRFDGSTLLKIPPNSTIQGDCYKVAVHLPHRFVDLLILDPPYNLNKSFNGKLFKRRPVEKYTDYLRNMLAILLPCLKQTASVYICGDWQSSPSIFAAASEKLIVRNRITWEREKGRGAALNWKNASEDIWFCTVSNKYTFNADAVMLRRKVLAPYRSAQGLPKDWHQTKSGNFRDTRASNVWTDITVPFWSMPENTDHPTQKSEKLIAKLILASSKPGDLILDPFLGSGTTSVAAKKLGRRYIGIEIEMDYCLLTEKRLEGVKTEANIQGFKDRIFWERNTFAEQLSRPKSEL